LRGYHRSSQPRGVGAYRLDRLAGDLRALLDDLGPESHPVVGHDWGGAVAWWGALLFPSRFARLAILNAPHPAAFRRALVTDREQRRRARYFLYFQLPFLPERKLAAAGGRALRSMLRRTSRPGTFGDDELARYAAAAAVPGALTAMLNWYRAALRRLPPRPPSLVVEPPVRIVWGTRDMALCETLVEPSARLCRAAEVYRLPEAGHWLQHEEPERVNALLLDFLAAQPVRSPR